MATALPIRWLAACVASGSALAQTPNGAFADPKPVPGIEAVVNAASTHAVVAIEELPACEQLHDFVRRLIAAPELRRALHDVVVDFGNSRFQVLLDRYVLGKEPVPLDELRHVWQDAAGSLQLTWDSPVYPRFFETVRAVNADLPPDDRIHVTLAGPPVDWSKIGKASNLEPFLTVERDRCLTEAVGAIVSGSRRALVISSIRDLRRALAQEAPNRAWIVRAQGRSGRGGQYRSMEAAEAAWKRASIAAIRGTSFGTIPIDDAADAPLLQDAADALLYLGPSDSLTILRPYADTFQDDAYWNELNRRSQIVFHAPFSFAKAGFDLRLVPPPDPDRDRAPAQGADVPGAADRGRDGIEFVLRAFDDHSMVGLADDHRGLGSNDFVCRLLRDPRTPDVVDDVLLECGNPCFQAAIDRYVVAVEAVARDDRKRAWQYAAMGWETSDSPVYEHLIDTVREVNRGLPPAKRMHVVLADAPIDPERLRENPREVLHDFIAFHETGKDPRERSLAASASAVIGGGRRGLMICGGGHLAKGKRPGNAREFIEAEHPGEFLFVACDFDDSTPRGFVTVEDDRAVLSLGPWKERREVGVPPRVFRDKQYWGDIDRVHRAVQNRPIDLREPRLTYRSLLYDEAPPAWLAAAVDAD